MKKGCPQDARISPRFCGIRTFMRLPHTQDLQGADFVIMGVPFDTGASFRVGARFAPEAIRSASVLLRPCHPTHRIDIFHHLRGVDYGDLPVAPGSTEESLGMISRAYGPVVSSGALPIAMGGDHTVTLPLLRVLAGRHGPIALLHFDSHSDTWEEYFGQRYFHGTTFRRAVEEGLIDPSHSVQVGVRGGLYELKDLHAPEALGFQVITSEELLQTPLQQSIGKIIKRIGGRRAYLSFDIDVLDPAFAPATGTPEIGGPSTFQIQMIMRGLVGLDFIGMDVVEVLPAHDVSGVTALAAATVIHEFMALFAMKKASSAS